MIGGPEFFTDTGSIRINDLVPAIASVFTDQTPIIDLYDHPGEFARSDRYRFTKTGADLSGT